MRLQGNIARQRRDAARRFVLRQATGAQRDSASRAAAGRYRV